MKYPNDKINTIIHGDCLKILPQFYRNCVDLILTDPPYGISDEKEAKMGFSDGKPDWMSDKIGEDFDDTQTDSEMDDLFKILASESKRILKKMVALYLFLIEENHI